MSKRNTYLVYYKILKPNCISEGNKFYYTDKIGEKQIDLIKEDISETHKTEIEKVLIVNIMKLDN